MGPRRCPQTGQLLFTPSDFFRYCGTVGRSNYKREWVGNEYQVIRGRFNGWLLSEVKAESWLTWALNEFDGQLEQQLSRALIDQLNSLHK